MLMAMLACCVLIAAGDEGGCGVGLVLRWGRCVARSRLQWSWGRVAAVGGKGRRYVHERGVRSSCEAGRW